MFPALVNCCTIDWFREWPEEALSSVAASFFQVCVHMPQLHLTADASVTSRHKPSRCQAKLLSYTVERVLCTVSRLCACLQQLTLPASGIGEFEAQCRIHCVCGLSCHAQCTHNVLKYVSNVCIMTCSLVKTTLVSTLQLHDLDTHTQTLPHSDCRLDTCAEPIQMCSGCASEHRAAAITTRWRHCLQRRHPPVCGAQVTPVP